MTPPGAASRWARNSITDGTPLISPVFLGAGAVAWFKFDSDVASTRLAARFVVLLLVMLAAGIRRMIVRRAALAGLLCVIVAGSPSGNPARGNGDPGFRRDDHADWARRASGRERQGPMALHRGRDRDKCFEGEACADARVPGRARLRAAGSRCLAYKARPADAAGGACTSRPERLAFSAHFDGEGVNGFSLRRMRQWSGSTG